jgi:uncharacterized protein (TIGR02246 family)
MNKQMTFAPVALTTLLVLAAGFDAAWSGDGARGKDEKAIRSLLATMMEEWNKHDVKSFMSHFTENSNVVTRVGERIRGRAAHEEHLRELHASPFRDQLVGRTSRIDSVRFITPDVAVVHEIAGEKIGKSVRTYVLSRQGGQWKIEANTVTIIGNPTAGPPKAGKPGAKVKQADVGAILDRAIVALGGEERLSKIKAATWKTKGTISFGGMENQATTVLTVQGLDHFRQEFEGGFGGKGILVLAGDKGWRNFGGQNMAMDKDGVADLKRTAYLTVLPITLLPLKSKDFKVEALGEEKAGDKILDVVKATGPDGKDFTLYFDKESGLLVKHVAKVSSFMGAAEVTQEMTFGDYKRMDGILKATKIEARRDGELFFAQQVTAFQILEKVDPKTFTAP